MLIVASSPQDMFKYGARFCSLILSIWFRFVPFVPFYFWIVSLFFNCCHCGAEFSTELDFSLLLYVISKNSFVAISQMKGALISPLVFVFFDSLIDRLLIWCHFCFAIFQFCCVFLHVTNGISNSISISSRVNHLFAFCHILYGIVSILS